MKTIATIAILALAIIETSNASAQPPAPGREPLRRPGYSPYLNLTRPGGGAVQNYYGLVRPEVQLREGINQLRQDAQTLAAGMAAAPSDAELATGHPTGYMTHLRYFGTNRGSGGAAGANAPPKPAVGGAPRPSRQG